MDKHTGAFLTIGELAAELNVPQHILRYWETRFPMLRPLQRAGNRRYYRAEDVALARRIHHLLNVEGYTVRGAQQALEGASPGASRPAAPREGGRQESPAPAAALEAMSMEQTRRIVLQLEAIRGKLETALS